MESSYQGKPDSFLQNVSGLNRPHTHITGIYSMVLKGKETELCLEVM